MDIISGCLFNSNSIYINVCILLSQLIIYIKDEFVMFILVNIILFIVIFGYIVMILVKFFKCLKEGDCGGCKFNCKCDMNILFYKNKLNILYIKLQIIIIINFFYLEMYL